MKNRILAFVALLLIVLSTLAPLQNVIPQAHAQFTGTVCVAPTTDNTGAATTTCPSSPVTFTGPVTTPASQLRVAVFIQNSDPLLGFDVTLSTDPTMLRPADADSTGTILVGALTVLGKCIQGVAVQGGCGPGASNNVTALEFAVVGGGGLTTCLAGTCTGLLFTAIYDIVGRNAAGTPLTINFARNSNCSPSSNGDFCVSISNGTTSPPSENLLTAEFDDSTTPQHATWDTPSISALSTLAPASGTGTHAVTANLTPQNGMVADCAASSVNLCTVSFTGSNNAGPAGLTVTVPLGADLSTGTDGTPIPESFTINVASSVAVGNYTITVTANYQIQVPVGTGPITTLSEAITIPVAIQDFTLTASPSNVPFWFGQSGKTTITITPVNHFSATTTISNLAPTPIAPTPPTPVLTVSESPTSIPGGSGTSTATFTGGTLGGYTVSIRGAATAGGQSKTKSITVTVRVQDFNITSSTSSLTIDSQSTGTATITLGSQPSGALSTNGFAGTITLTSGATPTSPLLGVTFNPNPVSMTAGQKVNSTVTFTAPSVATLTSFTVTINGTATLSTSVSATLIQSVTITVTVRPVTGANYIITAKPTTVNVRADGSSNSSTITLTPQNGFTGTITLTNSTSPATGITCALSQTTIILGASGTSTLTCRGTTAGSYSVTVTGTNGTASGTHSVIVTFNLQDFTVAVNPTSITMAAAAGVGSFTITVTSVLGFQGNVTITLNVPGGSGLSCQLSPSKWVIINQTTPGTLVPSCSSQPPGQPGTYTVTVTGTNGTLSHSATVTFQLLASSVCIAESTATVCPSTPPTLTGAPGTQLRVAVLLQNSNAAEGFDIILKVNDTILQPAGVDLTGTILLGSQTILAQCIGGSATQGRCSPGAVNQTDTLEFAVTGSRIIFPPVSGLLFTAIFNITGTTLGPTTIGFQSGTSLCTITSHDDLCLDIGDGTTTPVPIALVFTANFDNTVTNFTMTLNPPSAGPSAPGTIVTSTITVTAILPFASTVTLSAPSPPTGITASISPTTIDLSTSSSGTATLTVNLASTLRSGTYRVIVRASGGGQVTNFAFFITVADFIATLTPVSGIALPGGSVNSTITIKAVSPFSSDVSLTTLSAPTVTTVTISPATISLSTATKGNATLTVVFSRTTTSGNFQVTVRASGGTQVTDLVFQITVSEKFLTTVKPTSGSALNGASVTSTINVTAIASFTGVVTLTLPSPPTGLSGSISPSSIDLSTARSGTATLTINLSSTIPGGSYNVTIEASGGGQVTDIIFRVTVTGIHDVAIVSFTVSPSGTATAGDDITYTIFVQNKGTVSETVTVNALANNMTVASGNFTIAAGATLTATLHWNTSGYGSTSGGTITYQLGAQVQQVPGEVKTSDNTQLSGSLALSPPASSVGLTTLLIAIIAVVAVVVVVVVLLLRRRRPAQAL